MVKNIKILGNLKYIDNNDFKNNKVDKNYFYNLKNIKLLLLLVHMIKKKCLQQELILFVKENKNLITIIIPRHINRVDNIINEIKNFTSVISKSSKNKNLKNIDIFIVDTFGESKKFYKIATSVFLGGSIANKGGQNP